MRTDILNTGPPAPANEGFIWEDRTTLKSQKKDQPRRPMAPPEDTFLDAPYSGAECVLVSGLTW